MEKSLEAFIIRQKSDSTNVLKEIEIAGYVLWVGCSDGLPFRIVRFAQAEYPKVNR